MTDLALLIGLGLQFALLSLLWPLGFVVLLSFVGLFYRRRHEPDFVLCINALLHLVVFSSSYTVLMYCLATLGRPLIDAQLVGLDAWFGFHLPDLVSWMQSHSTADGILKFAYSTLLPQTALGQERAVCKLYRCSCAHQSRQSTQNRCEHHERCRIDPAAFRGYLPFSARSST